MTIIDTTIIDTTTGKIAAQAQKNVLACLGIPYAQPLTGLNRIRAPQPRTPWSGVLECQQFGLAVPQEIPAFMGVGAMGDDCLNLNIWTPAPISAQESLLPVVVWVHGGGYVSGSSAQPLYHGAVLCSEQQIVVVSINYRIGLAGFACWDAFTELAADNNCGLRDLTLALQWIQDNIAQFGGNPKKITLWGHSSGAMAVATLLAVPSAQHLFHQAIIQSGSADHILTHAEATRVTAIMQQEAGNLSELWQQGSWSDILKIQRHLMNLSLARAHYAVPDLQFGMPALPCIDAAWLPTFPLVKARSIPLLIGTTHDEWSLYLYMPELMGGKAHPPAEATEADWNRLIERSNPTVHSTLRSAYEHAMPEASYAQRMVAFESDRIFRRSSRALADRFAQSTYVYRMDWLCHGHRLLKSCHVVDIPMMFAKEKSPLGQFFTGGTPEALQLGLYLRSAWGRFIREQAPDPMWPVYGETRQVMILNKEHHLESNPEGQRLSIWDSVLNDRTTQQNC